MIREVYTCKKAHCPYDKFSSNDFTVVAKMVCGDSAYWVSATDATFNAYLVLILLSPHSRKHREFCDQPLSLQFCGFAVTLVPLVEPDICKCYVKFIT